MEIIEDWDLMEKFLEISIIDYLKCQPEDYNYILTEPTLSDSKNREIMTEIFFEKFNAKSLYIGKQSIFAFYGFKIYLVYSDQIKNFTKLESINNNSGLVIESGESSTTIIPICEGNILGSKVKKFPINGRVINDFIIDMIKNRKEKIKIEDIKYIVRDIKKNFCYFTKDLIKEFEKYDLKNHEKGILIQNKRFNKFEGIGKISNTPFAIDIGYEQFLAPELFFSPEIINSEYNQSLDEIIDSTIQSCPLNYRPKLFGNIMLSGRSTHFKYFENKLEYVLEERIEKRLKRKINSTNIKINISSEPSDLYLVFLGASSILGLSDFKTQTHTREEYLEKGKKCCQLSVCYDQDFDSLVFH